jgi:hypothetical protein
MIAGAQICCGCLPAKILHVRKKFPNIFSNLIIYENPIFPAAASSFPGSNVR